MHVQYDWLKGSRHNGTHMMVLGVWQRDQGERRQAQILRKKSIRQQAFTNTTQYMEHGSHDCKMPCIEGPDLQRRSGRATPTPPPLAAQMSYVYKDLLQGIHTNLQSVHSISWSNIPLVATVYLVHTQILVYQTHAYNNFLQMMLAYALHPDLEL